MQPTGIARAIDILTNSGPRIPSIRQETARWREKRAERKARENAERLRGGPASLQQPKSRLYFAPTRLLEPEWILDEISHAWDVTERGAPPRTVSELRSIRAVEADHLTLAANIQPGSHVRGTTVESNQHQLAFPVVIPQRCPGSNGIGFADVYAPALGTCHMGQNAFRRFLEGLEAVMQGSTFAKAFITPEILESGIPYPKLVPGGQDRFDLRLRRSMVDQYLEEANRIVFLPKNLAAYLFLLPQDAGSDAPGTIDVNLSRLRSAQPLVSYDDELDNHIWDEFDDVRHEEVRVTASPLILTGLERAAVKACHGDREELSRLRTTYADQTTTIDSYFENRLQAAGVRTTSKGTIRKHLFESVDARPQNFKTQGVERLLRTQVLYLVIRSSNANKT